MKRFLFALAVVACAATPQALPVPQDLPAAPDASASVAPPATDAGASADAARASAEPDDVDALRRDLENLAARAPESERERFEAKRSFETIARRADPRLADDLWKYLQSRPPPEWRTQAALRLAELGDLRAASDLAWRLRQDPLKLYPKDRPELRRDDAERVAAARHLADLAKLHPERKTDLLAIAGDAALSWATSRTQPHANALRFLAAVESTAALPRMRAWASPTQPLPALGSQSFPEAFATAQIALRYVGAAKDEKSWDTLVRQLQRRPPKLDVTMNALIQGGAAVAGMALRALTVGAAHGFAEWGDPKARPLLLKFVEDRMENEQARQEACAALAWVSDDAQMRELAAKAVPPASSVEDRFVQACKLHAISLHPSTGTDATLLPLLSAQAHPELQWEAARAIGTMGIDANAVGPLRALLSDPVAGPPAALALLLGGDNAQADEALATSERWPESKLDELKIGYQHSLAPVTDRAYDGGHVARWARNALSEKTKWPRELLARQLQDVLYDNGPHSLTRVMFRARLWTDARGMDAAKRDAAIAILELMKEEGMLRALRAQSQMRGGS